MQPRPILLALLLCLAALPAAAWPALVERVIDGDTIEVLADQRRLTVRLSGIDAPERGQPGGAAASRFLQELALARSVEAHLRVLAGVYEPTGGRIRVEGRVTPLFDLGLGMDMDASGYDNIRMRAAYFGISPAEIERKMDDIAALPNSATI